MSDDRANALSVDLDHILTHTRELWEELRDQRLFITGGTGFFGCWLLESLVWANERLNLNATAQVLTRNVEAFRKKAPHLATNPAIQCYVGDVRSFGFPRGAFSHVIHLAPEARARVNTERPLEMLDTIVQGTRHTLDFAVACGARKFLLASSGAVYGRQPAGLSHIPEDYCGSPDQLDPTSSFGECKRMAELLCSIYKQDHGIEARIARCFAFVGPYLSLKVDFAVANFIRDGMRGGPIKVTGDGTPLRSYLYAADLAIWLWTILFRGESCRAYNVGSETAFTIAEVARIVAHCFGPRVAVQLAMVAPDRPHDRYVPSVKRARAELGLQQVLGLPESIRRTVESFVAHEVSTTLR